MLATIALIGRPNVGKSTLFNRLLRRNKAITHDMPGVTRDRIHGVVRPQEGRPFTLVDTGGLVPESNVDIERAIEEQAAEALAEAQAVLFVVDAREGVTPVDAQVARDLRQSGRPVLLVANKVDGREQESVAAEFHSLGLEMVCVSAEHGHGVPGLLERLERFLDEHGIASVEPEVDPEARGLRVAMLGRPNAGKSSIINAILGERRLIVSSEAGTTRDSVDVTFERGGRTYTFVDTAGVRRRTRIEDELERFSVLKSLKSSAKAEVAVLVVDGLEALSHQDKRLIEFLDREKTPFIVAVNKTDLLPKDAMAALREHYAKELSMVGHVPIVYTSALTRAGLGGLLPLAEKIWAECSLRVGTGELNRIMQEAIDRHQPPLIKRRRAKFYYLTQAGTLPPTFVFFVNDPELVKESYQRYLEKQLRKLVGLTMAPMAVHFRASHDKKPAPTTKPRRPAPEPRRPAKPRQKSTKLGPAPKAEAPAEQGAPAPTPKGKGKPEAPKGKAGAPKGKAEAPKGKGKGEAPKGRGKGDAPRPAKPKGRAPAKGIARKPGGGKSGARKAGAGKGGAKGGRG
ncbi:ribosome biogenesis GTPase Der [Desulfocurvus vexinensis]|uniref:ribosome biogenesis GTPase Der n=1 Tax=Desulfocurvus vexinensis TaxID=399548 RepID=UPI0004B4122C